MSSKRIVSIVVSLVLALALVPALALAAGDAGSPAGVQSAPPAKAAAFKHEAFKVLSPKKGATYQVKKDLDVEFEVLAFKARYVNGFLDSTINHVFIEIQRNGVVLLEDDNWIYASDVGSKDRRTFTPTKTGTYTVRLGFRNSRLGSSKVADDTYVGSYTFIVKKGNPFNIKGNKVTLKESSLAKKAKVFGKKKAFTIVKKAKGKVTYKAVGNVTENAMKKVKVASDGKVTVKKGTKAGVYKLKVKATAAGSRDYCAKSKTVTLAVKVQ